MASYHRNIRIWFLLLATAAIGASFQVGRPTAVRQQYVLQKTVVAAKENGSGDDMSDVDEYRNAVTGMCSRNLQFCMHM